MSKAYRFNNKKTKWSLVHFNSIKPLPDVLAYGAHKYSKFSKEGHDCKFGHEISKEEVESEGWTEESSGAHNWKKGSDQKEILESLMRHLTALMDGETNDPESGLPHIGHIMCNAMFYQYFENNKNGKNNETKDQSGDSPVPEEGKQES